MIGRFAKGEHRLISLLARVTVICTYATQFSPAAIASHREKFLDKGIESSPRPAYPLGKNNDMAPFFWGRYVTSVIISDPAEAAQYPGGTKIKLERHHANFFALTKSF